MTLGLSTSVYCTKAPILRRDVSIGHSKCVTVFGVTAYTVAQRTAKIIILTNRRPFARDSLDEREVFQPVEAKPD
jgi:hypothetical protein